MQFSGRAIFYVIALTVFLALSLVLPRLITPRSTTPSLVIGYLDIEYFWENETLVVNVTNKYPVDIYLVKLELGNTTIELNNTKLEPEQHRVIEIREFIPTSSVYGRIYYRVRDRVLNRLVVVIPP
ncbi:MAG: hypothetical protein ABWW65_07555 [Thermoprotei archaeon]